MDMPTNGNKPKGWGQDELTKFIDLARHNVFATFNNKSYFYNLLTKIDAIFQKCIEHMLNTKSLLPSILLMRSHSAYRGSCILSLSGMIPESFVLGRSCIEYSLYALHMEKNPNSQQIWVSRHNDLKAIKSCKGEFTFKNVISTLKPLDNKLFEATKILYENTINFGGHPNEKAITQSMKIHKDDKGYLFKQIYLSEDSIFLDNCLKNIFQIGLCS